MEMSKSNMTTGMLLDGAQMSISALIAGTMGFLKERNIDITEWVSYIGQKFTDSLKDLEGEPVEHVLKHLLELEIAPLGAEIISIEGKGDKAEAVLTALPGRPVLEKFGTTPRQLLRGFSLSQKEFESILDMFQPAASSIGLRLTHHTKNSQLYVTLAKGSQRRKVSPRPQMSEQDELTAISNILSNYEHEFGGDGSTPGSLEMDINEPAEDA
jgi:hypothetical protein